MTRSIDELNALDRAGFVSAVGGVFEGSPWIAERAWDRRPFRDRDELHHALCAVLDEAAPGEKLALIRAHPDLVGGAARAGTLTPESAREQGSAGLDRLTPAEIARFDDLNRKYREKFGFPFVICVRENRKEGILRGFAERLPNDRAAEIRVALEQIGRIAGLRIADLMGLGPSINA